jgi:hypothetical protein
VLVSGGHFGGRLRRPIDSTFAHPKTLGDRRPGKPFSAQGRENPARTLKSWRQECYKTRRPPELQVVPSCLFDLGEFEKTLHGFVNLIWPLLIISFGPTPGEYRKQVWM